MQQTPNNNSGMQKKSHQWWDFFIALPPVILGPDPESRLMCHARMRMGKFTPGQFGNNWVGWG